MGDFCLTEIANSACKPAEISVQCNLLLQFEIPLMKYGDFE